MVRGNGSLPVADRPEGIKIRMREVPFRRGRAIVLRPTPFTGSTVDAPSAFRMGSRTDRHSSFAR